MAVMTRYQMIQMHMLLAAFLLPLALMYLVSGILYTLDVKGHIKKQEIMVPLEQAFVPNLEDLKKQTINILKQKHMPTPGGEPSLKKRKGVYELYWSDLKYAVKLQATSHPMTARLTVKKRNFLAQVMRIHRAEAGLVFQVFTIILVLGLMTILLSGVYMALMVPKFKRPVLWVMSLGFATFWVLILV